MSQTRIPYSAHAFLWRNPVEEVRFYFALEKHHKEFVRIYRVCVGVRRRGINAHVRSMIAFCKHERKRQLDIIEISGSRQTLARTFYVMSSGQFEHYVERESAFELCQCQGTLTCQDGSPLPTQDVESPRALYALIGYDPKRRKFQD
jgi:hypothetical protein